MECKGYHALAVLYDIKDACTGSRLCQPTHM